MTHSMSKFNKKCPKMDCIPGHAQALEIYLARITWNVNKVFLKFKDYIAQEQYKLTS